MSDYVNQDAGGKMRELDGGETGKKKRKIEDDGQGIRLGDRVPDLNSTLGRLSRHEKIRFDEPGKPTKVPDNVLEQFLKAPEKDPHPEETPERSGRLYVAVSLPSEKDKGAVQDALTQLLSVVGFDPVESESKKEG